ncbi:MAG: phosphoribosylformylglycinamidine synthase subunit PurQ [Phycisphaerales bacterium]|nr:phosphoribosylformylglycinamidine synthase subunit PurQ [Phycisphaerae bacterium]NNF44031.1 phosphoribosylformylglycinamidine synthase subunit PurQ [Phycisphaerales bacterium]NNM26555.1 phosphoribosylformylglycinamidine synthase subunit PurQ [Phycisphaerales bacterium]
MGKTLIITTAGINCDRELAEAFALAGATPESRHLNELMADPAIIDAYDLIGIPGGFSYGDAVAAGRVAAQLMRHALYPAFVRAIERGVPIIAPCNGFQIAVQMGLLPGGGNDGVLPSEPPAATVTLAVNESARFVDRWTRIEIPAETRCVWTRGVTLGDETSLLPVAHGEGRFIPQSSALLAELESRGQVAVRYAADDNPNGSVGAVAGICDPTGLVLGLMPHPERYTRWTQHPWWTRLNAADRAGDPPGLQMFRNAVTHAARCAAV